MSESNQISRKRMRFSSSSASQLLTKTKSQKQSPSLVGKIESKIIRSYPRVTIRDLRLRRVFSPNSISIDWELKTKERNPKRNGVTEEIVQTNPLDTKLLSAEAISVVNEAEEINVQAVKRSGANLCSKSVLHPCSRAKIFKNPGSVSYKRLLPYLMQAADDGTSSSRCLKPEKSDGQDLPSINLSSDKEIVETAEGAKEGVSEMVTAKSEISTPVLQVVDMVVNQHLAESVCGNTSPLKRAIVSSPNKRTACSRRKLFKTPGSFNYRRMLPYLKDIQDGVPVTDNHPDHQKITEENTPSSIFLSGKKGTQDKVTPNIAKESETCSNEIHAPLPCDPVSVSPEQSDLDKEQETQVKHVIPDTEKNLETPQDVLLSDVPLSSPQNILVSEVPLSSPHNVLVSEVPISSPHSVLVSEVQLSSPLVGSGSLSEVSKSALDNSFVDNVVGEEQMNGSEKIEAKTSAEQLEADSPTLTAELPGELETPLSVSPSKGNLKRNIRGCRGICSCLNCSSFRLNAERAFEFSRNQLQDTEVMVLDLVGEISHLRDMLEKCGSANHNESYKSQAGEASKRASEAAELAKSRLLQMNDALQVHCRIPNEQRARVKFAHYVQEKTILKASVPNNLINTSP